MAEVNQADAEREALEGILILRESQENLGGRPRLYETPEQFDEAVGAYYQAVLQSPGEPLTLYGLILHMGFADHSHFDRYASYEGFSQSVSRAKSLIKYGYERAVVRDKNSAAARILGAMDSQNFNPATKVEATQGGLTHEERLELLR